jgi:hypothetical protein
VELPAYQTVPVTCPNCKTQFATPLLSIIDVGQNPEAKTLLLSGRANVAVCPQCGNAGMLNAPLVYHDPEKEILFTYVPQDLGVPDLEQQRIIGELTNRLMSSLPPEQRKGYLLNPRNFLRLEGMIEAILEADGITKEMQEEQRAKAALLDRLLRATSEEARQVIAQENDKLVDYEFFQLLSVNLQLAQAEDQDQIVQELLGLRRQLLEWTTTGRDVKDREEAIRSLGSEITREGLLDRLVEAALADAQGKIETLVAVARPAIDYVFYQQLTTRIEGAEQAGDAERAKTLKALRERILDLTAQIDAEMQKASEQAARFLETLVNSQDIKASLLANLDEVDEVFLNVLVNEMAAARRAGQAERAEKLEAVNDALSQLLLESQPPEVQFVNQLLAADYPQGSQALLDAQRERVNQELLQVMDLIAEDMNQRGQEDMAQQLAKLRAQAAAML